MFWKRDSPPVKSNPNGIDWVGLKLCINDTVNRKKVRNRCVYFASNCSNQMQSRHEELNVIACYTCQKCLGVPGTRTQSDQMIQSKKSCSSMHIF